MIFIYLLIGLLPDLVESTNNFITILFPTVCLDIQLHFSAKFGKDQITFKMAESYSCNMHVCSDCSRTCCVCKTVVPPGKSFGNNYAHACRDCGMKKAKTGLCILCGKKGSGITGNGRFCPKCASEGRKHCFYCGCSIK